MLLQPKHEKYTSVFASWNKHERRSFHSMMQQLLRSYSWYSIPKFIFSEASTTMQIHITPLVKKWWTSFIPIITSIYFGSKISKQVWWTVSQGSPSGAKDHCCASKTAQHKTITSRLASCYHHRMMHSISICVGSRIAKQVLLGLPNKPTPVVFQLWQVLFPSSSYHGHPTLWILTMPIVVSFGRPCAVSPKNKIHWQESLATSTKRQHFKMLSNWMLMSAQST